MSLADRSLKPTMQTANRPKEDQSLLARIMKSKYLYLMVLPTAGLVLLFSYLPALIAIYRSFYMWDGIRLDKFIGFGNFSTMLQDPVLLESIPNMLKLLLFSLFITLTVPLTNAVLIYRLAHARMQYWLRVLFIVPAVVPSVVTILLWTSFFSSDGLINIILRAVGLDTITRAWLGDPDTALYAIMGVGFPWAGGLTMLFYLAGLMNIPESLIDAATVDGATGLRRFWSIELPLIMGQVKLFIILTIIGGLQNFSLPLIMTDGGPGYSTMVPALRMYYAATQEFRMGYASAIGLVLFLVIFGLTYVNLRYIRTTVEFEAQ